MFRLLSESHVQVGDFGDFGDCEFNTLLRKYEMFHAYKLACTFGGLMMMVIVFNVWLVKGVPIDRNDDDLTGYKLSPTYFREFDKMCSVIISKGEFNIICYDE